MEDARAVAMSAFGGNPADGSEETLTASEFDLLKVLAENPNRLLQRDLAAGDDGPPRDGGVRSSY